MIGAADDAFVIVDADVHWGGHVVAMLMPGPSLARPKIMRDRSLDCLDRLLRDRVEQRLSAWLATRVAKHAPALIGLADMARDRDASAALRAVAGMLEAAGGIAARLAHRTAIDALSIDERRALRRIGIVIGALDLYDPRLLKPRAALLRRTLMGVRGPVPVLPPDGATVLPRGAASADAGFRPLGQQAVRIDLVERIARAAHDARRGRAPFAPDAALSTSIGLEPPTMERLMTELGFRATGDAAARLWVWRGRPPAVRAVVKHDPDNAFAALAGLRLHG